MVGQPILVLCNIPEVRNLHAFQRFFVSFPALCLCRKQSQAVSVLENWCIRHINHHNRLAKWSTYHNTNTEDGMELPSKCATSTTIRPGGYKVSYSMSEFIEGQRANAIITLRCYIRLWLARMLQTLGPFHTCRNAKM